MKLMLFMIVVTTGALAAARADCDACVDGQCHSRRTLVQGLYGDHAMDVDRKSGILYLQVNPNITMGIFLKESKIQLIETPNTSGLAFDQNKQVLFTSGDGSMYKYKQGSNITEFELNEFFRFKKADKMVFNGYLYFTPKCCKGFKYIKDNEYKYCSRVNNYAITDFVRDKNLSFYFVADENVYHMSSDHKIVDLIAKKNYVLSTDKNSEVYFGDPTLNVIYKVNNDKLVEYAVYNSGSVGKFVFDDDNNIVFHNSTDGSLNQWKLEGRKCSIELPHSKYFFRIDTDNDNSCNPF